MRVEETLSVDKQPMAGWFLRYHMSSTKERRRFTSGGTESADRLPTLMNGLLLLAADYSTSSIMT